MREEQRDIYRVVFDQLGEVTLARRRSTGRPPDDLLDLTQTLVRLAPVLEQGLIRRSKVIAGSWSQAVNADVPLLPYGGEGLHTGGFLYELRHLLDHRTLDAYGVQILTDEHLANATDLSNWDIRTVAPGRHLVSAPKLAPWYAADQPDAETLERARCDFRDLILNPAVVASEPPQPW